MREDGKGLKVGKEGRVWVRNRGEGCGWEKSEKLRMGEARVGNEKKS